MTTKNPRLTITLQPSLAAQLRKLSELTGNSQSGLIGEMLEGSGPVFDRMIQVMEAAKTAKESMRGKLIGDMEHAQNRIEGALGIALDDFDNITGSLFQEAESVPRRARPAARPGTRQAGLGVTSDVIAAASSTPISNRGVRLPKDATKAIAREQSRGPAAASKQGKKIRGGV